ncbi:MAG TPA: A/G-specific adenine glycosylase [Actinomycetota bacterium]|nr:A/G-specific adenine glycosylase [Actinomycetota bacterium]
MAGEIDAAMSPSAAAASRGPIDPGLTPPLLRWYEDRRGAYPWRGSRDPYAVLVSEVMLQQTQAARVVPVYRRFLERFPDVATLAGADRADVVRAWEGLGHNRRAVAISEAARAILRDHDGRVPADVPVLRSLPGVGPYTAAAVAAIAFGVAVVGVDTNVRRVVSRVAAVADVSPLELDGIARTWLGTTDPSVWHQAVMDLGRTVCRPRARCDACPLAARCPSAGVAAVSTPGRRQGRFEGSSRQVRGAIVRELRSLRSSSLGGLARRTGANLEDTHRAVIALASDGVVTAGEEAVCGSPRGRVRLAGQTGVGRGRVATTR